ncbi:unnamed protein product [Lathyrus oleraceus]
MADRHDNQRHKRIVQHTSVRREKSQVSEAPVHYGQTETSTSKAHTSPFSSSRRRQVSPTNASLLSSFRSRKVSSIQAPEVPESSEVVEAPMPLPDGETAEDDGP